MRYITEEPELKRTRQYVFEAAEEARKSACRKSQRGAVLVKGDEILGRGHNRVTLEELCKPCIREGIRDNSMVELCSAVHAEQMAIIDAAGKGEALDGSVIYHIKVKNGGMRSSGPPSCTVCSRMLYAAGIALVLLHDEGYAFYGPQELNELSFGYFKEKLKRRRGL